MGLLDELLVTGAQAYVRARGEVPSGSKGSGALQALGSESGRIGRFMAAAT